MSTTRKVGQMSTMSRQLPLTAWLTDRTGGALPTPRSFFFLNQIMDASWSVELPPAAIWKRVIRVGTRDIVICSDRIPPERTGQPIGTNYDPFLKSHLQKAVRLRKARAAIFTTDLLLQSSHAMLLRRLPIIMVEDSLIHQSFNALVWFMCLLGIKDKNYALTSSQERWVLGTVWGMLETESVEIIEEIDCADVADRADRSRAASFITPVVLRRMENLPDDIQNIIYSLETRRLYGGLKGDSAMLWAFEASYIDRTLMDLEKIGFYRRIRPILTQKTAFGQEEWLLEAYDFHCCPAILMRLCEQFSNPKFGPDYSPEDFKAVIWHCSSKINTRQRVSLVDGCLTHIPRETVPGEVAQLWSRIRKFVRAKAWGYTNRVLEEVSINYPHLVKYAPPALPEAKVADRPEDKPANQEDRLPIC